MTDSYVIGIKLALDNGVVDGIAAIRRDLAALDAAVAASTENVRRLRALASDLPRLAGSGPAASAGGPPAPRDAPKPPAVVDAFAGPDRPATPVQPPSAPSPISSPLPVMPAAPSPIRPAQPAPYLAPAQSAPKPLAQVQNRFGPTSIQAAPVAPQMATVVATPAAPSQRQQAAPVAAPGPSTVPRTLRTLARPAPLGSAVPRAAAVARPLQRVALPTPPAWSASAASLGRAAAPAHAQPVRGSPAVVSSPRGQKSPDRGQVIASHARQASAPPAGRPSQASSDAPTAIYVDGHAIGRFMADTLGRAATQPTASATAFDRRLTPAWPATAS